MIYDTGQACGRLSDWPNDCRASGRNYLRDDRVAYSRLFLGWRLMDDVSSLLESGLGEEVSWIYIAEFGARREVGSGLKFAPPLELILLIFANPLSFAAPNGPAACGSRLFTVRWRVYTFYGFLLSFLHTLVCLRCTVSCFRSFVVLFTRFTVSCFRSLVR